MRLIEKDALINEIKHTLWDWDTVDGIKSSTVLKQTISDINNMPTVDAEPVRHGKWHFEEYPDGYYHSQCSLCNSWFVGDAFLNPYNYCPNCGAKLDKEEL